MEAFGLPLAWPRAQVATNVASWPTLPFQARRTPRGSMSQVASRSLPVTQSSRSCRSRRSCSVSGRALACNSAFVRMRFLGRGDGSTGAIIAWNSRSTCLRALCSSRRAAVLSAGLAVAASSARRWGASRRMPSSARIAGLMRWWSILVNSVRNIGLRSTATRSIATSRPSTLMPVRGWPPLLTLVPSGRTSGVGVSREVQNGTRPLREMTCIARRTCASSTGPWSRSGGRTWSVSDR